MTGVDGVGMDTATDPAVAAAAGAGARPPCRAISIRWRCCAGGAALARRGARHPGCACAAARSSSIWAMASCRKPRPSTSPRWSSSCAPLDAAAARSRSAHARRSWRSCCSISAGRTGRRRSGRSWSTCSRDPAILRVPFFVRPFLARSSPAPRLTAGQRELRPAGRPLAAAGADPRPGSGPGGGAAGARRAMLHRHALLAPVQRRGRPARCSACAPDQVLLLPLYPQYSTTTTGSSLTAWREAAARAGLAMPDHGAVLLVMPSRAIVAATAGGIRRSLRPGARSQPRRGGAARAVLRPWAAGGASCARAIPTSSRSSVRSPPWWRRWQGRRPTGRSAISRAPRRSNG